MGSRPVSPTIPVSRELTLAPLAFRVVRRLCERPGCGAIAEVSYGIDKNNLVVWIDNRAILERELAGRLCRRHANALVPPRGWTLDDRREPIPRLFVTREDPASAPSPRREPRRPSRVQPGAEPAPVLEFPTPERAASEPPVPDIDAPVPSTPASVGSAAPSHGHDLTEGDVDQGVPREDSGFVEDGDVRELTYETDDIADDISGDDTAQTPEGITRVDPDETQAVPWSPRLVRTETTDDPSGPVFGRLLGRAFGVDGHGDR